MAEAASRTRLEIDTRGKGHATLDVPADRLEDVRRILDEHSVDCWTIDSGVHLDGKKLSSMIVFSYKADVAAVQKLLDSM